MKKIILNYINNRPKKKLNILDWGCGNSLWSFGLFPGSNITGIDTSKKCLYYSKENAIINSSEFKGLLYSKDFLKVKSNYYDYAIAIALIELVDNKNFTKIFTKIYESLKPDALLFLTHHTYRPFSAVYLPWLIRGGYSALRKQMKMDVQRKSTKEIIRELKEIGFCYIDSGAFNPYPSKLWKYVSSDFGYLVKNKFIKSWYYTQYIVLKKS